MHHLSLDSDDKDATKPGALKRSPSAIQLTAKTRRWALWVFAGILPLALILILCLVFLLPRRQHPGSGNGSGDGGDDGGGGGNTNSGFYTYPASAYPSPIAIQGTVPHNNKAQTLDPSLVRRADDGKYFLFTTGGPNGSLWTADSVSGPWTKVRGPDSGNGPLLGETCGAPQVYGPLGDDSTYYLFHNSHRYNYAKSDGITDPEASKPFHDASQIVHTSRTLEPGSWTRQGRLEIPWARKYNILDAALLTISANDTDTSDSNANTNANANNTNILAFGSYQTGIYAVPLDDPPTQLLGGGGGGSSGADAAMEQLVHLEQNSSATQPLGQTEAAYLYSRGSWTYLFFSSGRCCPQKGGEWPAKAAGDVYRVMVCRRSSDRAAEMASWADEDFADRAGKSCRADNGGTEILASHGGIWAPGGQGILEDDGAGGEGLYLYYHYVPFDEQAGKPEKGFRFGFNKLQFDNDAWPVVV